MRVDGSANPTMPKNPAQYKVAIHSDTSRYSVAQQPCSDRAPPGRRRAAAAETLRRAHSDESPGDTTFSISTQTSEAHSDSPRTHPRAPKACETSRSEGGRCSVPNTPRSAPRRSRPMEEAIVRASRHAACRANTAASVSSPDPSCLWVRPTQNAPLFIRREWPRLRRHGAISKSRAWGAAGAPLGSISPLLATRILRTHSSITRDWRMPLVTVATLCACGVNERRVSCTRSQPVPQNSADLGGSRPCPSGRARHRPASARARPAPRLSEMSRDERGFSRDARPGSCLPRRERCGAGSEAPRSGRRTPPSASLWEACVSSSVSKLRLSQRHIRHLTT